MASNYQPISRRAAAAKAEAKIKRDFEIWDDWLEDGEEEEAPPEEEPQVAPTLFDSEDLDSSDITEEETLTEAELAAIEKREAHKRMIRHLKHERRRAARNVHSSDKLELSRRMTIKMIYAAPPDAPQYSPLRCVKLGFKKKDIKVVKITRHFRGKDPVIQRF